MRPGDNAWHLIQSSREGQKNVAAAVRRCFALVERGRALGWISRGGLKGGVAGIWRGQFGLERDWLGMRWFGKMFFSEHQHGWIFAWAVAEFAEKSRI